MSKIKTTKRDLISSLVARALRNKRQEKGISMQRLAEQAGLSTSMISLMERDLRNPTLDTLLRISDALEVDLSRVIQKATTEACRSNRT